MRRSIFRRTKRTGTEKERGREKKNLYGSGDRIALHTSSVLLLPFLLSPRTREREESRESRCRATDFIVAGKLRVIGVVINEPASYIGR